MLHSYLLSLVAFVGLTEQEYAASEDEGFVTICVELIGPTSRTVVVSLTPAEDTAQGNVA